MSAGPFLCSGTRKLVFHSEGKIPEISMLLKNVLKMWPKLGMECLITSLIIPSVKADLPFFKVLPIFEISSITKPGVIVSVELELELRLVELVLVVSGVLMEGELVVCGLGDLLEVVGVGGLFRKLSSFFFQQGPTFPSVFCEEKKEFFRSDHVKWKCLMGI